MGRVGRNRSPRKASASRAQVASNPVDSVAARGLWWRTGWRRWMARLGLAVGVPILVVLGGELVLRVSGYGHSTRFFVRVTDDGRLATNRRFGGRFLPRESATQPVPMLLPARKAAGVRRIFILGESAAQGTPAPAFGFARILEVLLTEQYPGHRFEVVNAAMRGVNSHVVLPIARECAGESPDLFVVYLGNNEMVGLHAPEPQGWHLTPYRRGLQMWDTVKGWRFAQVIEDLAYRIRPESGAETKQDMGFFRGKRMARDHPRRQAVYDNFRANLAEICEVTRASGARVLLCTVAVNLRDFPPLASVHRPDLTSVEALTWETHVAQGTEAEFQGRWGEAVSRYQRALHVDDHFAELHYRLARCLAASSARVEAARGYQRACDRDALQFRTDSRQNEIIRETVKVRRDPGLELVDVERAFAEASGGAAGVPGERWFHEHVHFRFEGDYLLANTVLPAVVRGLGLPQAQGTNGPAAKPWPTLAECAAALAYTEWDDISVESAMARLTAAPPFLDQLEHSTRQRRTEERLAERLRAFQRQDGFRWAEAVYRAAIARRPDDWQLHWNHAVLLQDAGRSAEAEEAMGRAVTLMPISPPLRVQLAQVQWKLGKQAEARQHLREALRLDPAYPPARTAWREVGRGR